MVKDKYIISKIKGFFHKNDNNKAINGVMRTIKHLNLRPSSFGVEKTSNNSNT